MQRKLAYEEIEPSRSPVLSQIRAGHSMLLRLVYTNLLMLKDVKVKCGPFYADERTLCYKVVSGLILAQWYIKQYVGHSNLPVRQAVSLPNPSLYLLKHLSLLSL